MPRQLGAVFMLQVPVKVVETLGTADEVYHLCTVETLPGRVESVGESYIITTDRAPEDTQGPKMIPPSILARAVAILRQEPDDNEADTDGEDEESPDA